MFETCNLKKCEIDRYGRQIIIPSFGVNGQQTLKDSKILIIGCGGLGCPSGIYLAASGVGTIGLVDHDTVDESNLHRQICHKESKIGKSKVESLSEELKMSNSSINIELHPVLINKDNGLDIIAKYDIVLDCTDNVVTRYLINDCCVILKKPLVSASALGFEGQLTIYNYQNGPCYRCLFPVPPPANAVTNCNEGGVLGPVTGLLGTLQAMEAIKIQCRIGKVLSGEMLLYDAENSSFRNIKLRPRDRNCAVCGDHPTVTVPIDYQVFCNALPSDACGTVSLLERCDRVSVNEYRLALHLPHVLIDVRPRVQIEACKFKNAIEVPMSQLGDQDKIDTIKQEVHNLISQSQSDETINVFVVCRRGNNSQIAVQKLRVLLDSEPVLVRDIVGGMTGWGRTFDPDLPIY